MEKERQVNRTYKDGVFRKLFNNESALLELYNALSGRNYPKNTPIRIVTLEECLFGDLKNDVAFIIDGRLIILVEHQSTANPNMPFRMLCYLAREYEREFYSDAVYSRTLVKIPAPEMYVFYNGTEDLPLEQELKLSDAFLEKRDTIFVEVTVKVINVNYEKGARLLQRCRLLQEYSILIHKIRLHRERDMELKEAISASVRECVEEGILAEFLKRNGGEIMSFLYQELSREECEAIREQDGYTRGLAAGREEGRREGRAAGRAEGRAEGREEGRFETLGELVRDGTLTLEEAANRLNGRGEAFMHWYRQTN